MQLNRFVRELKRGRSLGQITGCIELHEIESIHCQMMTGVLSLLVVTAVSRVECLMG